MRSRDLGLPALFALLLASSAAAQDSGAAAIEEGRQLLREHNCNGSCHQSHSADNEALSLYTREDRKAVSPALLDRYVRLCVANVGSMIFPEDIPKIVKSLDADFYKFK